MIKLKTRFGDVHFAVSDEGLAQVLLPGQKPCCVQPLKGALAKRVAKELSDYFAGKLKRFTIPLDISGATPFGQRVLRECFAIPYGTYVSYGDLAKMAGSPKAARAVGRVMATNPIPIVIPCHRVVGSDGGLHGYGGGLDMKQALLVLEGIAASRGNKGPKSSRASALKSRRQVRRG